jgi:Ribosome-associated heat shock protein implicated in the recycling of the 50S subunit (S4 paralog)
MDKTVRIDKFLWSVRIFKTRSDAAEACHSGKVLINDVQAKSSKEIKSGDKISVRKGPIRYEYIIIEPIDKRQGAALVENYITNVTPQSELDKLLAPVETFFVRRDRGTGRPTKKERRELDKLMNYNDLD